MKLSHSGGQVVILDDWDAGRFEVKAVQIQAVPMQRMMAIRLMVPVAAANGKRMR